MVDEYKVYVTRDDRLEERGYDMGLDALHEQDDVDVSYLPERDHHVLKTEDLAGADAVVSLKDQITAETLEGLDSLEIIGRFGAGFDNVDIPACTERNILVTNAPQGMRRPVAQSALGMLLVCASHMRRYDHIVRTQGFDQRLENMGVELFEKTVGTIGMGGIGSKLVELLQPFDVQIKTYDPYMPEEQAEELQVEKVDLDTLLRMSDFISLHCPLTEETRGMLGEEEFRKMKSTAYVVNTTRGGIYPDRTLATALEEGWIGGAAIDVFENEPHVEDNPLLEIDECLVMPHAAGINKDGLTRVGNIVSDSILSMKRREIPGNVLNPQAMERTVPSEKLSPSYH